MPRTVRAGEVKLLQTAGPKSLLNRTQSHGGTSPRGDCFRREGDRNLVMEKTCDTWIARSYSLGLWCPGPATHRRHDRRWITSLLSLKISICKSRSSSLYQLQDIMKFANTSTFLCKWAIPHESHLFFFSERRILNHKYIYEFLRIWITRTHSLALTCLNNKDSVKACRGSSQT